MLAGLPKAPSAYNPVANPKRAAATPASMFCGGCTSCISSTTRSSSRPRTTPLVVRQTLSDNTAHAEFVAEMVRLAMVEAYGEESYTRGLTVYTTIRKADQDAAYACTCGAACSTTTGATAIAGPRLSSASLAMPAELEDALDRAFEDTTDSDNLVAAIVLEATPAEVKAVQSDGEVVAITGDGLKFAARALGDKAPSATRIRRGALIRVGQRRQGPLADRAGAAGRGRIRVDAAQRRNDLSRWSAGSTSTAASSIT